MTKVTVGSVIDHYKILEEIGQGGMGVVFKALNVNLDKTVAVKTIALGLASDEIFLNRFRTEARALARLQDPNIVNIFDLRLDDNQWFIVMEFVEGITLGRKIRENGAIPWRESLTIFKQMLSAIGHAHRVGIIHRDIKPNNVMITANGIVKVTDFGLAKDKTNLHQTMVASTGGTLFYMSPEQVKGLQFTDYRSDIYALGLTFYEMLTGKIPFRKDDTDFTIREAILRRQFPIPGHFNADLPHGLNSIVMKAIEKKPEDRFQSVDEMFIAIEEFEQDSGLKVKTVLPDAHVNDNDISALPQAVMDISYIGENSNETPVTETRKVTKSSWRAWWWYAAAAVIVIAGIIAIFLAQKDPPAGVLSIITSSPSGAEIIIDDVPRGRTPLQLKSLKAGTHSARISKADHVALDTVLQITADSLNYLNFDLIPFGRLSLAVNPDDAELFINDQVMDPDAKFENIPVAPGEYTLRLEHRDFYPLTKTITIRQDHKTDLKLNMNRIPVQQTPDMASISIISIPETTRVFYDGEYIGSTPLSEYQLAPGTHQIILRREGYRDQGLEITAAVGQNRTFNARLEMLPASLSVKSEPLDARIWVDDQLQTESTTPALLTGLTPGLHKIRVEKEGYQAYESGINVKPGSESEIFADLMSEKCQVAITVLPWGSIYIDGELLKEETNTIFRTDLTAGKHLIKVHHPVYGIWQQEIALRAGDSVSLPVNFNEHVNISVTAFDAEGNPVWAEIIVDDKLTGEMTPKEIALRVGQRTIAARKEGYILVSGEKQVMIEKGQKEPIRFILKKVI